MRQRIKDGAIVWILNVPRSPCVKGMVTGCGNIGRYRTFKRWDIVGGKWVIGCVALKGILRPWPLPLSLFASQLP
jgi:hypothetical protein